MPLSKVDDLEFSPTNLPATIPATVSTPAEPYEETPRSPSTPIAVEIIRALTPLALAAIGCILGVAVLMSSNSDENARTAGFGLASTAIAGAAGLAQTSNSKD